MISNFQDTIYREIFSEFSASQTNIIKKDDAKFIGKTKVSVEDIDHEGVKIIIKKDAADNVHEIKFVCSCGQTKSIVLDYSE